MTLGSMQVWGFIAAVGAGLPTVLGGCSIALNVYMDRISAAHGRQTHGPLPNPSLEDRHAYVQGPSAITPGPAVSQMLVPTDRQYLLDRSTVLLRRRLPKLVAVESRQAAVDRGFATILELDVVRFQDKDEDARVRFVLRVWDANGTLASIIQGQLYDVDVRRGNQRKVIDAALPLIDAKADMLLRSFQQ
jgi:hypothetical protein